MGTKLPLYGYVNPYAHEAERGGRPKRGHDAMLASVEPFMAYISRDDVKAHRHRLICDNGFNPDVDQWTHAVVREEDPYARPVLADLLRRINKNGSIVVPTLDDIKFVPDRATIRLVQQILRDQVPVIEIHFNPKRRRERGEPPQLLQYTGQYPASQQVFDDVVDNSMLVRRELEFFVMNRVRMISAVNKGLMRDDAVGEPL